MEKKTIILAGGCFWCVEADSEKLTGITDAVSGYTGGTKESPTYDDVVTGKTGHREAVLLTYDPSKVSLEKIVEYFMKHHDPTDAGGSFHDRGHQYTSAIYVNDEEEKQRVLAVFEKIREAKWFDKPIVTSVEIAKPFYNAEDFHQDYARTHEDHYNAYRRGSGREGYVKEQEGKEL